MHEPLKLARVASKQEIAPDVLLVEAQMVDPPLIAFEAGQFVNVPVDAQQAERRAYSISSMPSRVDGFELLVKLVPDGRGSEFFRRAGPGDAIPFEGPMGNFTAWPSHPGDVVFAVTGSGLAAALPLATEILARPPAVERGRVFLYWGLRREEDIYWRDRLEALAVRSGRFVWHVCLSRPRPDWNGVHGRINDHVLAAATKLDRPVFYLVGNGDMIRDVRSGLAASGVPRKQVRLEVFYPATER